MADMSMALGLFWAAFLAATILPMSSEAALSAALLGGVSPAVALFAATIGNVLGSATTFGLGRMGKLRWLERYCRVSPAQIEKAQRRIGGYGEVAALFCFLPFIGDVFAIALGFMRYPTGRFLLLMATGKLLRYLLWMALHVQLEDFVP